MEFTEKLKSLKSLWGLMTGSIVLFPGASYLFNLADIQNSVLSGYYVGFSTVISLLALMYVLSFMEIGKNDTMTMKIVVISGLAAFLLFSGFIIVKKGYVYDRSERFESGQHDLATVNNYSRTGLVAQRADNRHENGNQNSHMAEYVSMFEILSMMLFVLSVFSFTVSFSCMGVYHYYSDRQKVPETSRKKKV